MRMVEYSRLAARENGRAYSRNHIAMFVFVTEYDGARACWDFGWCRNVPLQSQTWQLQIEYVASAHPGGNLTADGRTMMVSSTVGEQRTGLPGTTADNWTGFERRVRRHVERAGDRRLGH